MDRMTKEEMLRMLTEIGEHVPDNWTRAEIQHRMESCYKARGIDVKTAFKKQKTPLRSKIAQLNAASRKKADLVKLLQEEFMMDVNPLQTIKQLQGKALDYIYEHTACSPDDQVSFGRHAQMTYVELKGSYPQYCDWVIKTSREEKECCIHLRRFAMWLEQEKMEPITTGAEAAMGSLQEPPPEEPRFSMEPMSKSKAKASPKKGGYKGRSAPSAASAPSEVSIKTEVLQDLVHSVAALREEVANMKEERPRKKESRSEFSLVSSPAEQDKCRQLSVGCASRLEDAAWSLVPKTFQDLVNQGCAEWNGVDLAVTAGELSYQAVKMECTGRNVIASHDVGKREMVIGKAPEYQTFGAFSHGGQYGTTVVCHQFPETVKYLNAFLRSKTREHDHWSSFTINRNQKLPIHRDVHNHAQELSMICGFGSYSKGELWVEDPDVRLEEKVVQRLPDGREVEGRNLEIRHQLSYFNGKAWHGPQPWTGNRITLTAYTSRGVNHLTEEQRGLLSRTLRLDPAGAFRSHLVEEYCDKHGIFLDIIPGEAHWKIGACENAIKGLKEVMAKLCTSEPELSLEEALSTAVRTFNQRDMVRGFSPVQHALGRSPDETGRILDTLHALPPEHLIENASGEFERATRLRQGAEKAHADWQAQQRLTRAANSRHKPRLDFEPGELVFFWRTQESGQSRKSPGSKRGRFLGPARILAVETTREPDGTLKPGSAVWLVRGRSLMKCCPEQLRRASPREELLETLAEDKQAPWSFTKVAEEIGGNQYQDISGEKPEADEWHRAQDVEQEVPPRRVRLTRKRPGPAGDPDAMEDEAEADREPATSSRRVDRSQSGLLASERGSAGFPEARRWWEEVSESAWVTQDLAYWNDEAAAVAVEIDTPDSKRGKAQLLSDMSGYFISSMKRRAVEVSEKRLSPEEKAQFREAKNVEVRNFVAAKAFECLPEHLQPSREQAIGMRWILTWKVKDSGERKAKARAVLLGYQDPSYEHRSTAAPVMTRQSRQFQLQLTASRRWRIQKGDVSGAFLQGREYKDTLYCTPSPEICEAMGIPVGSITRLRRACYGLVDAPLEWYRTVAEFLEGLGLERLWSDSCAWVWRKEGQLRGMISGHVDDFLFSGDAEDQEWQAILQAIQQRFKWSDWETDSFVQCGVQVTRVEDGFELSQPHYLEGLHEICVSSSRRKEKEAPITDRERSQLRTLLGGLSWHAQQVAPHVSAEVGLLLSEVSKGTVSTILRANLLLYHTKARGEHKMKIHAFHPQESLALFAWVDASDGNRPDGGSTQGIFIGLGPEALFRGDMGSVTPISWHSTKIDRMCRSPGAAEVQAAINGEDQLHYARYQWSEILYGNVDVRNPDATVRQVQGGLITDSRNVFDKLQSEVLVIKGAEKKSNIELLGLKEAQARTQVCIRWVHSEAQLANALTKDGTNRELELYYRMRHSWRIVEDPEMQSARKRKSKGVLPLDNPGSTIHEHI
ncbi:RE1 [Symbiodinium sp. CCMP2456]|nr:RE1 [Symbiodinium sp. CCMP2456]